MVTDGSQAWSLAVRCSCRLVLSDWPRSDRDRPVQGLRRTRPLVTGSRFRGLAASWEWGALRGNEL